MNGLPSANVLLFLALVNKSFPLLNLLLMIFYITHTFKQQTWKTHNHQSPSNGTQATFKF